MDYDSDEPAELGLSAPLRCAVCLAMAVHDSRIGTTSAYGHLAVTIAEGTALCLEHFMSRDISPLLKAGE